MFRTQFAQRISALEKRIALYDQSFFESSKLFKEYHELLKFLEVKIPVDGKLIRVGPAIDSGYILFDDFSDLDSVISLGIGRNVDTELYFAELGIDIFLFDGTVKSLPKNHERFKFSSRNVYGSTPSSSASNNFILSNDIFKSQLNLFAEFKKTMRIQPQYLFLVDIEGSEYDVILNTEKKHLVLCQQITVEFHDIFKQITNGKQEIYDCLVKLNQTHELISIHGNNYGGFFHLNGNDYPDVLETTWLRKDLVKFKKGKNCLSHELNKPNNPGAKDLNLEW
jgi:hypothetical protein